MLKVVSWVLGGDIAARVVRITILMPIAGTLALLLVGALKHWLIPVVMPPEVMSWLYWLGFYDYFIVFGTFVGIKWSIKWFKILASII